MNMQQTIILAVAIVIGGFLLGGRYGYEIELVGVSETNYTAMRLNRFTGSIKSCGSDLSCVTLKQSTVVIE